MGTREVIGQKEACVAFVCEPCRRTTLCAACRFHKHQEMAILDTAGRLLLEPHADVGGRLRRRQARFLSGVLLVLIPFMLLGVFFAYPFRPDVSDTLVLAWAGLSIAYGLSRTRHYLVAAFMTIAVEFVLPHILYYQVSDSLPGLSPHVLSCIFFNVLLGSFFLRLRGMAFLSLANIAAILASLIVAGGLSATEMVMLALVYSALCGILLLAIRHRDKVEAMRLGEIEEANRTLTALKDSLEVRVADRTRELAHAYESLKRNQSALLISEKMATLGRLSAGIAHEINTPLATMRTAMSVLGGMIGEYEARMRDPGATPESLAALAADMRSVVQAADASVDRAAQFISSMRAHTRGMAEKDEPVTFDAEEQARGAVVLVGHEIKKSCCDVSVETSGSWFSLRGSPGRFSQVVTNLLTNAIGACAGMGECRVVVRLSSIETMLTLEVTDTGCGIPEKDLSRIFDPLFTTRQDKGGTGLGLTIVHDIVTADFGGTIHLSSKPGAGATFRVHFPRQARDAA